MSRQGGRRKGPTGGLFGLIGSGVGMAAEYHEHRKQQKQARTDEARNGNADETAEGPSSRSLPEQPRSDQPPAYDDIAEISERTLDSGNPVSDEKKITDPDDLTDVSDSDDDDESIEDDEEMWELDEALTPHDNDNEGLPSYDESEASQQPVEELVRDVLSTSQPLQATSSGTPFEREPLPCPVIIPQRRPRKKARGFIRAYAPVLDGCGIDQTTFLSFLKNFHKSSKSSPIFPAIQIAAGIAGMAPSVIAMAVCTAAQIAAGVGAELQTRGRTNQFLDRMNDELFKPAGLYAMIVKYKSDADMEQNAATRSLLSNLIQAENVDLSTNQVIAKYARTASDQAESSGSRSIGDRMKQLRLASDTTRGTVMLPESAPLIFPDIDDKVAKEGPETFKDKTKDAKKFLADYLDRRAQVEYVSLHFHPLRRRFSQAYIIFLGKQRPQVYSHCARVRTCLPLPACGPQSRHAFRRTSSAAFRW